MTRLNLLLLAIVLACSLALVTSQHQARKLYTELTREQELANQLEIEYGQLQLELSTWATHARIEKIATRDLQLRTPVAARTQVLSAPVEGHP